MVNYHILSSLLVLLIYLKYMTKHISHTCGRRSCRTARYLLNSSHSHISERCLATALRVSSSITTGRYALNKDVIFGSGSHMVTYSQYVLDRKYEYHICRALLCRTTTFPSRRVSMSAQLLILLAFAYITGLDSQLLRATPLGYIFCCGQ